MGCVSSKSILKRRRSRGLEDPLLLASQTCFSINEVEALFELYDKLSSSLVDDGYIQKEEFQLALFRDSKEQNFFSNRLFDLFDTNQKGAIEFGGFVRLLSFFHPNSPKDDKISFAFRFYDVRQTGYIERDVVKGMVVAVLSDSNMIQLPDEMIDAIVDKTFSEADANKDGKIDYVEWKEYVSRNPTLIKNMNVPYLTEVTMAFPSFVFKTQVEEDAMTK